MNLKKCARVTGLALCAFAGGAVATFVGHGAGATSQDNSPYSAALQLGRVLVAIENEYVEPVERTRLVNGAISGMVAELDPHSSYMAPEDWKLFQSETEGHFGGIGVEVDARDGVITVIAPIEGSPAERAGVRSGDKIVAVDGQETRDVSLEKLVRKMRGVPGTHVKIRVKRDGVKEPIVFDLVRQIVQVRSVESKMLDSGIAYVRCKEFQEHTHDELLAAVGRLRHDAREPVRGVIFDLRSNPGGLVDEAAEVADEFLSSGTIFSLRHRGEIIDEVRARSGGALASVPLVVLVNEYTASAAELVAGALQDHKRGEIVGAPTFGKGSVQSIIELPGGAGLKLTTARYYTPSGRAIQAEGVHPDVLVESAHANDADASIVRERDLEGHLAGEGPPPPKTLAIVAKEDAGAADEASDEERVTVRNIPSDPTKGSDFALSVGYRLLRTQIEKRR